MFLAFPLDWYSTIKDKVGMQGNHKDGARGPVWRPSLAYRTDKMPSMTSYVIQYDKACHVIGIKE